MADEERTILIDVEVSDTNADEEVGRLNDELEKNKTLIRELKKDYSQNSTEIAKLESKNKQLAGSKRDLIKQSQTEANSLNALRLKLASLTKERNNTNTSTKEGATRFKELQKEIAATSEEVKGFEEEGGDFRRSVGEYPSLLGGATTGFKKLFTVLLTNPIGLIVTALVGLVAIFKRSQTGIELFRKAGAFLNTVLGKLTDIVEALGIRLIAAFEDPQQALDDLVDNIREGVIRYFTEFIPNAIQTTLDGFALLGKAVKQVFTGDFGGAAESAREGIIKLADGITDLNPGTAIIKALASEIKEIAIEANEAATAAFKLESQLIANEKALADLAVSNAQSLKTQKELNIVIEDQTRSIEDRIEAGQKFSENEEKQLKENLRLQSEKVRILKETNALTNSTEEDIQRVRDAEIELANLQAASFERTVTNQNKVNALIKQQATEEEARIKAINDAEEKLAAERDKRAKEDAKRAKELSNLKIKAEQETLGALSAAFGQAASASKGFALTQIAFDTAQAISALVRNSESNPANAFTFGGAGIAQFIAGLARITFNIAKAKQILNSGGSGASVPSAGSSSGGGKGLLQRVVSQNSSNEESAASQLGNGARTNANNNQDIVNGVSNLPPIQVSVTDINTVSNRVAVKESEASLG